jgi:bifunctional oligoribonuclease and PAP phosphatase NrnA
MIDEKEWDRAVEALTGARQVVVACHVFPDGDALGSMLGIGLYLRRLGKQVWMGWGSPQLRVPPQYAFLPGLDLVGGDPPAAPEVFLAVDCAQDTRLDLLLGVFKAAGTRIDLDHHATNLGFGDINLVDPEAASSCELVYELIRRIGGTPNTEEATALYTGIVTDTGRFQYSSTSPATLRVAADLRDRGVDHTRVSNEIFESAPFGYLHTLGMVLSRARLEDGLVWSWLELKDLAGTRLDEAEDMINQLRSVREAGVAVLLKETEPGHYKVSMRSRGNVDVAQIAAAFGGGGHARAAGFPAPGGVEETIAAIRSALAPAGAGPPERAGA